MRKSRTTASQKRSGSSREKRRKASGSSKPSSCMKRQTLVRSINCFDGSQIMPSFEQFGEQPCIRLDGKGNVEHLGESRGDIFWTGELFVPALWNSGAHPDNRDVAVVLVWSAVAGAAHIHRYVRIHL